MANKWHFQVSHLDNKKKYWSLETAQIATKFDFSINLPHLHLPRLPRLTFSGQAKLEIILEIINSIAYRDFVQKNVKQSHLALSDFSRPGAFLLVEVY